MRARLLSIVLVIVLLLGVFSGCGRSEQQETVSKPSKNDQEIIAERGRYAYKPEWIPIDFGTEHEMSYVANYVIQGSFMFFYGDCIMGEEPWIDEFTGALRKYIL